MNNKWLPWILTGFITVGGAIMGYTINRVDTQATAAQHTFVPKDQYNKDQGEVCDRLSAIEIKIDRNDTKSEERVQKILDLLIRQEKRDKARQ